MLSPLKKASPNEMFQSNYPFVIDLFLKYLNL